MDALKRFLTRHPVIESAARHFATAAAASFAVAVLPVVQDVGAGRYNLGAERAIVVSALVGAGAAGARALVSYLGKRS